MNIVFVEPRFPDYQRQFVRALRAVGAYVMVVSEYPYDHYDEDLKSWIDWHYQIPSVTDEWALEYAVRKAQEQSWVDRLEATIEAHIMPAARVRDRLGIPGTSVRAAWLCRDKPSMKEALRGAGVPTAASAGVDSLTDARDFARAVGYPLILKPRDGAGAAGTARLDSDADLVAAAADSGLLDGQSVALEEFVTGHEGFLDTVTLDGEVQVEFVSHYYPNVLEAMRTRWISPQILTSNRILDPEYDEVRAMARKVIRVLELDTSATHMEWFRGPKGLLFSEIGARPPGVGHWDMYNEANEFDLYLRWAQALTSAAETQAPSYRYSAGIVALRPNRDGVISGYSGIEEVYRRFGDRITAAHLPPEGTPTQPVAAGYHANAWLRVRHEDFDEVRRTLTQISEIVTVWAQ